jgi:hypothetical protein
VFFGHLNFFQKHFLKQYITWEVEKDQRLSQPKQKTNKTLKKQAGTGL